MNYSIVAFDIENYSKDTQTKEFNAKRDILKRILQTSMSACKIGNFENGNEMTCDTGDGVYLFLDTSDNYKILNFMDQTQIVANNMAEIRFRGVFHKGDCEKTNNLLAPSSSWLNYDDNIVGSGFNDTARFLDSYPLKNYLKESAENYFVYGISDSVYNQIQNNISIDIEGFNRYIFKVKDYEGIIHLKTNKRSPETDSHYVKMLDLQLDDRFDSFLCKSDLNDIYGEDTCVLSEVYVYPELSKEYEKKLGEETIDSYEYIINSFKNKINCIISGDEQVGKTALCKMAVKIALTLNSDIPIYIKGSPEYSGTLKKKIVKAIGYQFTNKIDEIESSSKIVIIDDFHNISIKYQRKIIEELKNSNNIAILIVDSVYNINFYEKELIEDFDSLEIKEFNHSKRNELINKWMENEGIEDRNYKTIDDLTGYVNATLLNGLVPATPFNILVILSERKMFNPIKSSITSKGYCYQTLIFLALKKVSILDTEFDIYLNFLEYLSYHFYEYSLSNFSVELYEMFIRNYGEDYNQPIPETVLIAKLHESKIFCLNSIGEYRFSSKYIYYYFVAKYIANHKNEEKIKKQISYIYSKLENSENGYIGVFIIHHIKDNKILEEVEFNLLLHFESYDEAELSKDETDFLVQHVEKLSKISLKALNTSHEKRSEDLKMEDQRQSIDDENVNEEVSNVKEEIYSIRRALKTVEVMGQILKTRTGSFKKEKQKEYFSEALKVYLRITKKFLIDFKENEDTFLEYFYERIEKFDKNKLDTKQKYDLAKRVFINFNILNYLSCIKRTTNILSSVQIVNIIGDVCSEINTPLSKLIFLQCKMWNDKIVPVDDILKNFDDMDAIEKRILKILVVDYCELHNVNYKDKQRIAEALEMDLKILMLDKSK